MNAFSSFVNILEESFGFAWHAVTQNKLRTFLSVLGITVGIFSIILVYTMIDALKSNISQSLETLGKDVLFVQKWPMSFDGDYPWWKYMNRPSPTPDDASELEKRSQTAEAVVFNTRTSGKTVAFGINNITGVTLIGATYAYNKIANFEIARGRYWTESESETGRNVAIVGDAIAEGLFPGSDPVGQQFSLEKNKFTIIGVIKKQGESFIGASMDYACIVPLGAEAKFIRIRDNESISPNITVKPKAGMDGNVVKQELIGKMRAIRRLSPMEEDDFSVDQMSIISSAFESTFSVITVAGSIIGGFSILVGGFGIANIMFVSVKERTGQIGVKKALGAKNYYILAEFLFEAVILCLIGGLFGMSLVYGATELGNILFELEAPLTWNNFMVGIVFSVLIGLISGFIPALQAARMDPVEAIRSK